MVGVLVLGSGLPSSSFVIFSVPAREKEKTRGKKKKNCTTMPIISLHICDKRPQSGNCTGHRDGKAKRQWQRPRCPNMLQVGVILHTAS